jgi:hypothetical protein
MNLTPKEEKKYAAIAVLVILGLIGIVFITRANPKQDGEVLGESTEYPISAVIVERFEKPEEPITPVPEVQQAIEETPQPIVNYNPQPQNPQPAPQPQPTQPAPVSNPEPVVPPEPVCNPTLEAVIERPYPYVYHLGDRAEQITGSYNATCIEAHEVSYEWYIWGSSKNIPVTLFSTSADPDFSAYEPNTYDVLYRVKARGLSSEITTWVFVE